jgi:hypothetical protein
VSKPAAHIFVTELPANAANGALATGFTAGLPDVGTTVLGAALGVLGIARRLLIG